MSGIAPKDPRKPITEETRVALREAYPNAERLKVVFRLALDVDTAHDLLAGNPVSESRLDPEALFEARRLSLVQLRAPGELLRITEPAA